MLNIGSSKLKRIKVGKEMEEKGPHSNVIWLDFFFFFFVKFMIILVLATFSHYRYLMVFHLSLSVCKTFQTSWTHLSILANL